MSDPRQLPVSAQGECDLLMRRIFNARRQIVFDALTKPELLRRWFFGPPGWMLVVCELTLTLGGASWAWAER